MTLTLLHILEAGLVISLVLGRFIDSAAAQRALAAFPRSRPAAWILTAIDLAWVVLIMRGASLGPFDILKPYLPLIGIAAYAAILWGIGELLAVRVLGGLLLLLGDPILDAVRWTGGAWPIAVAILAYILVIIGAIWVLWPWTFRKTHERLTKTPLRWRLWSALWLTLGLVFLVGVIARWQPHA